MLIRVRKTGQVVEASPSSDGSTYFSPLGMFVPAEVDPVEPIVLPIESSETSDDESSETLDDESSETSDDKSSETSDDKSSDNKPTRRKRS